MTENSHFQDEGQWGFRNPKSSFPGNGDSGPCLGSGESQLEKDIWRKKGLGLPTFLPGKSLRLTRPKLRVQKMTRSGLNLLKDKFAFSRLIKVLYLRRENCLQNAHFHKQKGPCLKTHLNWTGSVFPLLKKSFSGNVQNFVSMICSLVRCPLPIRFAFLPISRPKQRGGTRNSGSVLHSAPAQKGGVARSPCRLVCGGIRKPSLGSPQCGCHKLEGSFCPLLLLS